MSSINTAYKGDFLCWTINLVEARKLVIADAYLDRLALVAARAAAAGARGRLGLGRREGPDPALPASRSAELMSAPDSEPDGIAYSWTDDARIMFTSGTTGRSKGVIKQNAADYFSARSALESAVVRRGVPLEGLADEIYFSCLPLFHSNAQVLCAYPALLAGARVAYVERFSVTRFWQQAIDAGATTFNGSARWSISCGAAPLAARPGPPRAHGLGGAGAEGHVPRVRGALRRDVHRGIRAHRDRGGHDDGPHPAPAPGLVRKGQPRLRGHDRGAGHRPPAAARARPARSSWTRGSRTSSCAPTTACRRRPPRTSAT